MERWQQIESLFQQALERDPAERNAWLREACQGDSDLRREVASLLANHQAAADSKPWAAAAAAKLIDGPVSLEPGQCLGPYRIESFLAAGGMGEVYRATDTRLNRTVAVKLSAGRFSERFEREARVIASLNHPNICTLYDVGPDYLVMEYVEGPTLAERIQQGPIPLADAMEIARQMAAALEEAHQRLVVHRDFKPGNVKIKPDRTVKVLDFGLAKLPAMQTGAGPSATDSPTLTMAATQAGVLLGTAAYMSPEQARGEPVDKRGDVWAFGVMLWEMLTGKRLFDGKTTSDVLAAVIRDEPDLTKVPARVRPLLKRCLEKEPQRRLRDIGDAMGIIENTPEDRPASSRLVRTLAAVAAVFALAFAVMLFVHFRETPSAQGVLRYTIPLPDNTSLLYGFAVSPNGRFVAMAAEISGKRQLWLRALDALEAQPLPGTDDAVFPFWSPDSRYIAFFAQGNLKKIAAEGGPAQFLCNAPSGVGSWNRDNVIVFSRAAPLASQIAIHRVSAAGGTPTEVIGMTRHNSFPVFLPDGRRFLYVAAEFLQEQTVVYLGSLDGKENRRVLSGVSRSGVSSRSPIIFAAGRLLFVRENTLMAQPFHVTSGQTLGEAVPIASDIFGPFSASETGVLVYQRGSFALNNQIAWFDRSGKFLGAVGEPGRVLWPAISPDEKSVVFVRSVGQSPLRSDLWLWDLARRTEQRFTTDPSFNRAPVWSPKGDRILFTSSRGSSLGDLYQKPINGSGQEELLLPSAMNKVPNQWSRDGRFIVYMSESDPKTKRDIWVLPMDRGAERKPFPFLHSEFNELLGQLSPDSHWMAYTSDKTGQEEVYVTQFPTGEDEKRISITGGDQPRWRGDGKELFFVAADGKMMAVAVKAEVPSRPGAKPSFEPGAPQPLFETHLSRGGGAPLFQYDVTSDGKRFLLDTMAGAGSPNYRIGTPAAAPPSALTVEVNWDRELKR